MPVAATLPSTQARVSFERDVRRWTAADAATGTTAALHGTGAVCHRVTAHGERWPLQRALVITVTHSTRALHLGRRLRETAVVSGQPIRRVPRPEVID